MIKKKLIEVPTVSTLGQNDKLIVNRGLVQQITLKDLIQLIEAGNPNIAPDLSAFSTGNNWKFENSQLVGQGVERWVSSSSPAFPVKVGQPYTLTVYLEEVTGLSAIQPVTGSTQHTYSVSSNLKGIHVYTFIPTTASCTINIYSSVAGSTINIRVSSLKVEEGNYPTGFQSLLVRNLRI